MSEVIKASKKGDLAAVQALLESEPALVNVADGEGSTPLHYAVWKGHEELVQFLVDRGANVNAHNSNAHWGTTPLHAAAHSNRASLIRLLVAHGAKLDELDASVQTPLDHTEFHKATAAAKAIRALMG